MKQSKEFPLPVIPGEPVKIMVSQDTLEPFSVLRLERNADSDAKFADASGRVHTSQYMDTAGRRSVVIGSEAGACEVWVYPFKAIKTVDFAVKTGSGWVALETGFKRFAITPETLESTFEFEDGVKIIRRILAPVGYPYAVFELQVETAQPLSIAAGVTSDLRLMWPGDVEPRPVQTSFDQATGAICFAAQDASDAVLSGWAGMDASVCNDEHLEGGLHWSSVSMNATSGVQRLLYVVSGSDEGIDAARLGFTEAASQYPELLRQTASFYRRLLETGPSLISDNPDLDEAFSWAVVGIEKCFMETPGLGAGYIAGYNGSGDGGRPGFGWYFGRDSTWTAFASAYYNDLSGIRENLRLQAKYQITEGDNKGKIFHELSAAQGRFGWSEYAFPAGDSTPFFVVGLADYYAWTGDLQFVQELWPNALQAMDWCFRMDVDADGLIDNPPAGHQWYDYGEKNMVDLVAIWYMALRGACVLSLALREDVPPRWAQAADRVREILNTEFWNDEWGYLYDRKLPDGRMCHITTCNPTIPLLWNLVDSEKAARAVKRLTEPDLKTPWGLRTNSSKDDIYSPDGYHEGTVWPLDTGWASLAAFANGAPDTGWDFLKANVELTRDFCLGYITEVLAGESRIPVGCPHQAWSEAMVVLPVALGIFGIRPFDGARVLQVSPSLPDALSRAKLSNVRIGDSLIDVGITREENKTIMYLQWSSDPLLTRVMPLVPAGKRLLGVVVNGQPVDIHALEMKPFGEACRFAVPETRESKLEIITALEDDSA